MNNKIHIKIKIKILCKIRYLVWSVHSYLYKLLVVREESNVDHNPSNVKLLSVCIPTYDMHGLGFIFLKQNFDILCSQTFKCFEVVITDNSVSDDIKRVCDEYKRKLDIKYFKNEDNSGGMPTNTNNAIKKAKGELIKILFLDDFLASKNSLQEIIDNFEPEDSWLVTACKHSKNGMLYYGAHFPKYSNDIIYGQNTIGSPSVLTFRNKEPLLYDPHMTWLLDCDHYRRLYDNFGFPKIYNNINVIIRIGRHQVTNTLRNSVKQKELQYMEKKYPKLELNNITLIAVASRNIHANLKALEYSCIGINFGSVKIVSDVKPNNLPDYISYHYIDKMITIDDWNYNIIYKLNNYVDTDFAILVHADGFIVNPSFWKDEFLEYDYIGAPFPLPLDDFSYRDISGNIVRVGNSVSLRSKRLLELPIKLKLSWEPYYGYYNEDGFICAKNRHIYEANGMNFAPLEVAKYFSHETMIPEVQGIKPFAFHKWAGANRFYPKF